MTVRVLTSPLLSKFGFGHGFSTRMGGVSPAPFDSLNLGMSTALPEDAPDDLRQHEPARIERNTGLFLDACGLSTRRPVRVRQVHGPRAVGADEALQAEIAFGLLEPADALISGDPNVAILVRCADCVPILIASPGTGRVAAIHAGWRGLVAGVIESALAALAPTAAERRSLIASIGPSIGVDSYEVGSEVAEQFVLADLGHCIRSGASRPHLDCHRAAQALLLRAGVPAERTDGEPICTYRNGGLFFSARRDGAVSGRMAAAIGAITV